MLLRIRVIEGSGRGFISIHIQNQILQFLIVKLIVCSEYIT